MNRYPLFYVQPNDDPLDIRMDNVFKAVFTKDTPESTGALSGLVSALIGRGVSIVSILANEPPADNVRDRQIRFDIKCRAENGELVNVEMCLNPDVFEPIRLGVCRTLSNSMQKIVQKHDFYFSNSVRSPKIVEFCGFNHKILQVRQAPRILYRKTVRRTGYKRQ
ncbi:MAG: Rpn family recombination-promoting nuclease/putative transposase [Treponema sp.]|nr:Rpn family recombination-promoting nuclease/putative transposase [Treponema sp.]